MICLVSANPGLYLSGRNFLRQIRQNPWRTDRQTGCVTDECAEAVDQRRTVSMCAGKTDSMERIHATIVRRTRRSAVRQQVGRPRAHKDDDDVSPWLTVTDLRYCRRAVVGRVLDDPQLSLSSLSSCVFVPRSLPGSGRRAAAVSIDAYGYLSRRQPAAARRQGPGGGRGAWRASWANVLGCLQGRRRPSARSHGVTWPRHAACCHLAPDGASVYSNSSRSSRPLSPGAACQATAPWHQRPNIHHHLLTKFSCVRPSVVVRCDRLKLALFFVSCDAPNTQTFQLLSSFTHLPLTDNFIYVSFLLRFSVVWIY